VGSLSKSELVRSSGCITTSTEGKARLKSTARLAPPPRPCYDPPQLEALLRWPSSGIGRSRRPRLQPRGLSGGECYSLRFARPAEVISRAEAPPQRCPPLASSLPAQLWACCMIPSMCSISWRT
jgi:hypothetical protein